MNSIITIFSQRLVGYLMYKGFVLGNIKPDGGYLWEFADQEVN